MKQSKHGLNRSLHFEALGTQWYIGSEIGISPVREHHIHDVLAQIDLTWSRFRTDSLVAKMSSRGGAHPLSQSDRDLMSWYRQLYDVTHGQVTPLIAQTLSDAGYDASYSLAPKETIRTTPSWEEVITLTEEGITLARPALIDVGAAGKGFAIDMVAALFNNEPFIIDAGGDMRIQGDEQVIGLEHPWHVQELIGTITAKNTSICGSASNRRAWGDWHHIINPRTSEPVRNIVATWVIADNAMRADGIASALFFMPPKTLTTLGDFAYVVMYDNGEVYHTSTQSIQLFT